MMSTQVDQPKPVIEIPVTHMTPSQQQMSPPQQQQQSQALPTSSACAEFIDPSELKNKFYEFSSKFLLILLDCRTYNDFNSKHIKDSVHLNCRDRLTRKRLQSRKLTVKDLISSEEIKNKLVTGEATTTDGSVSTRASSSDRRSVSSVGNDSNSVVERVMGKVNSTLGAQQTSGNNNNMIVLYDDTTNDLSELSDQNPLKIVQDNIKQSGYKKDCRILKGGFKSFFESFPEFCIMKDCAEQQKAFFAKHKEYFNTLKDDQRQSAIENAVMTEITPYLFLGNEQDAKNCENLEKKGIYYILNVTKNIPFYNSTNSVTNAGTNSNSNGPFCYKRIAVNDCENQNLKNHFTEAFDFIDQAKQMNQKVLVHCQAGISRSPTIVIAYLMSRFNLDMNDAYNQVKVQRAIIGPNIIFMSQLMDFEASLKLHINNKQTSFQQSEVTPIAVVHTLPTAMDTNNTLTNVSPSTPPSTPIVCVGTQIEVQFINSQKENSENNSPSGSEPCNSYFKLAPTSAQQQSTKGTTTGSSTSSIKCNSSSSNEQTKNNSIMVFN